MIVKNEEDVLARCLNCIKEIADEIIIVDTGSTDNTKAIAETYTPNIYEFDWCDDFAAARNFAFSKASMEYSMWIDADDVIDNENVQKLQTLKSTLSPEVDMVYLKYDVSFDEQGKPSMSYYRERILKTKRNYKWVGAVHEVISPSGIVIYENISIYHKKIKSNPPGRNLKIYESLIAKGAILDPRQMYYYARELYYNGYYERAIEQFNQFLENRNGWIENKIGACKDLASCYYCINEDKKAIHSLFHSFEYDIPRAEICCDIGRHFFIKQNYINAIYWYELAASKNKNEQNGGFCLPDCYDYTPYIQLCVCYDRLGDRKKAIYYNEKAGEIKPNDKSYLHNKEYFLY